MIRLGRASSVLSNKSSSTCVAERENRLKFAPLPVSVAPSGWLAPTFEFCFMTLHRYMQELKSVVGIRITRGGTGHQHGDRTGYVQFTQPLADEAAPILRLVRQR